jgi:hypothetical protein
MSSCKDTLSRRFWRSVGSRVAGECWEWRGEASRNGYGRFILSRAGGKRRGTTAHRVAYMLAKGNIPAGRYVLHSCDNRLCVNPDHLSIGTHQDNMDDMHAKGRGSSGPSHAAAVAASAQRGADHWTNRAPARINRGSARPLAKLTDDNVRDIRRRVGMGESQAALCREMGVAAATVCNIVNGKTWRHLLGADE